MRGTVIDDRTPSVFVPRMGLWTRPQVQYSLPTHTCPVEIDANWNECSNRLEWVLCGRERVWPA